MSDGKDGSGPDVLLEAVFKRAFPEPDGNELINLARACVIRAKTGGLPAEWQSKDAKQDSLKFLAQLGFDQKMRRILADARPAEEIVLFVNHSNAVVAQDLARHAGIPGDLAGDRRPHHADAFNRSLHLLDRDLKAIDSAVEYVTGRPPFGSRSR